MGKILVKKRKSEIGCKPKQVATLKALGLRKIGSERIHEDNPVTRGMIGKVSHLVDTKEIS